MISFDRPEVLYILVDISATALGAQRLIKFDIFNVLTGLLRSSAPTILEPSYRIIGNMSRFKPARCAPRIGTPGISHFQWFEVPIVFPFVSHL
jgi:hypothetical protein